MTLKTGMLVGIVGSGDIGVLIQIRASSNTCVIKLNNGTLKKNVPLQDIEEAKDMSDTKEKKSPIRLGNESPVKPTKLAAMSVKTSDTVKTLEIGDSVRARCNGGSRWFPGKISKVHRDGTYDVEYFDGDIEKKMASTDVEAAKKDNKLEKFAVGDKVKARYKNGSKLFSGKISRVRSDGTYDIKYDDGDVETRVARDLIEPNSEEKDEVLPTKKSSGFRVGQSVKARYKGGKKLFPGKIKRIHSDKTYDIMYEDGDEEKRVKTEYIESADNLSDEDIKSAKTSSKTFKVGQKVKAHYKKGKRLFPGKISRVRSDGTYDIDYDDGEIETHAEAAKIQVDDEEDLFADSDEDKKQATKKKKWIVGDRVKAYYGKGKRLFPGKIAKVHMNGTYDIKYDDGDSELRVDPSLIEDFEDNPEKQKSAKLSDNLKSRISNKPLQVGDCVKYKRGTRFFPGKITRERMDGTFDIKYEDGDVEERVEMDFIQRDGDDEDKLKKKSFEVGDVVIAPFQRGSKLFQGRISRKRSDGTYDVAFDDGDKDTHVPADLIQSEGSDIHDTKPKKKALKVGDSVKARYKKGKKLFSGKVSRVRSDGTYDVEYDDGDVEMRVDIDMIEVPEDKKNDDDEKSGSVTAKKSLSVGDKVRARYNKGSKMISGEITAVHRDGSYDIRYEDGDKEKYVAAKDIELEEERDTELSNTTLKVGDLVDASYKNGVKMFPGKISRVHSDGTYDITFDDGDSERRVPRSRIKSKANENKLPKKKSGFLVGDVVKAKYKKGAKYFTGRISRIRSDGTYDIEYDDGDSESHVDSSLIVSIEPETATKTPSKKKSFEVGDVIKARYKKGTKLFSGKITRVRSDGTYDIRYDDGDTEMHVESSHIEAEEKISSHDKTSKNFTVGDKVNARYKGGLKSFPGKIIKVRMDGTYDIEYDDGDTEQRVKKSAIEIIPGSKPKKIHSDKDDIFGDSDSEGDTKKKKKGAVIKVGDAVEANFRKKGKFHKGRIVRVRSDDTFDIEYDVGASEKHVRIEDIKKIGDNEGSDDENKKKTKSTSGKQSSDSDRETDKPKPKKKSKKHSSSESSGSDHEKQASIKKGTRVTYRKAEDSKSRRIGVVRKVHSDGSYDVKYDDGDTSKRVSRKLLVECSDSEDSEDEPPSKKVVKTKEGPSFRRHEHVLSNWRRSSKLSKPRMTDKWTKATVLEKNSDGTYTIRYSDGVVEEDAPSEALKPSKKKADSDSDRSSDKSDAPRRKRKRKLKGGIGTESLFLLEQLAMTLFEEGVLKKKPKLQLLRGEGDSSSSSSDSSSSESGSGSSKSNSTKTGVDKILKRLFDSSSLQTYKRLFKENDVKKSGKISRSRIIAVVEELIVASKSTTTSRIYDDNHSVSHMLAEWFATHDDLRTHRHFEFKTLMLAFAYAKCRLGKLRMEQSVAMALEGRFASYHENKRQLELWQQKLGFRLFETLQRNFHDHALPNMIPARIRVSELSAIFDQVARQAIPNKPLDVYLQQQQLYPHSTLFLPEFLCCYYQLYGSENPIFSRYSGAVELRPIAFVASCLFSNGDIVCKRHGDLVRRLCVGRTQAQVDLILRFREAFESLLSTDADNEISSQEMLLETSQLSMFAAKVAPDPTQLEPALNTLRKRSGAVSLVEIYASCGFIIDELTSAPTIRNAVDKMRMRVELADVRRIIGLVRNICLKILRFPNNADYWRIRADNAAFQQKIGRFDGATSLLEAVGFVEHRKTHYELRGARNYEGKRVSALEKSTLDSLREKCVQLDGELSLFDGVESISSILQRISKACRREGNQFTLEECQTVLRNLSSYIENILKNPKDSRFWRIREANSTFQRQIGYLPYATELMESIGFDLAQTSHGKVYTLRGTGMTKTSDQTELSASLSNFAFSSVSSQMEWFLWRRKHEIDSLLEDEMRYLHDIVGHFSQSQNSVKDNITDDKTRSDTIEARDAALVKMYPYGTNAIETFNKTSIQRHQLDMMREAFKSMDVDQKGFLLEADFSRVYGAPSALPAWCTFEAFDIGKDNKVDLHDFVAALGPLLDHPYELKTDKNDDQVAEISDNDTDPTLCEATSLAVGGLRLETSCIAAATVLEGLLNQLYCIIQEPGNPSLWAINDKNPTGIQLLRFAAGRALLRLVGFRESTLPDDEKSRFYELQPQRVRFKTSNSVSELPTALDTATIGRIQTIAAMLAGHYRGMKNPSVSDVSAVSRAISTDDRCSENWIRVVQLAVKCLKNIQDQPENPRYREINTATNTFTKIVNCAQGGLELLLSIGFRETDSGTLAIPPDTPLDELKARQLELEVGLALLHLRLTTTNDSTVPQKADHSTRNQQHKAHISKPAFGTREHLEQKKKMLQAKTGQQPQKVNIHRGPAAARNMKTRPVPSKQRVQSARSLHDPIEQEILADIPHEVKAQGNAKRTLTRQRSTGSNRSHKATTMGQDRASMGRKMNGNTMVLAADACAGADVIVVEKGQFLLRGTYVRIGAEIPDLYEERMVVEVSSDQYSSYLTKLRLAIPLRFFHPAKELVSIVLLSSVERAKYLEISETQTFVREVIVDIVSNAVKQASLTIESSKTPITTLVTNLVTSFEPIQILPIPSPNLRAGPSMRYLAAWSSHSNSPGVFIIHDEFTERKLQACWEGLILQAETSNKTVRLGDVKQILHRNAYLSLLSTSREMENKLLNTMSDESEVTYEEFQAFFRLPKPSRSLDFDEDNDAKLQTSLTYLRKHFTILLETTTNFTNGYKPVQAYELLHRVLKDVQDHIAVASDDPQENLEGLEFTVTVCQELERVSVTNQRSGLLSWPEIVYFVRYNKRLITPEISPSSESQSDGIRVIGSKEVAEVVSGNYTSRVLVLYFDGSLEVWNLSNNKAVLESKAVVLFSTEKTITKSDKKRSIQAWNGANQICPASVESSVVSSRIRQFQRSTGTSGALVRLCAWDSVLCVNSSILQEPGSETFRFFRLANNFVCPIRQVAVEHVNVELSLRGRDLKKNDSVSSAGVVKIFEVTADGSKIIFLTGSERIIWVARAGTGEIVCHIDLQVTQLGKFQALFQIVEKYLPCGEFQTQLYATTTAKSYRHAGLWILPQTKERKRVFSFGNAKVSTVVQLVVRADLLFVASRDGLIMVWSTTTDQNSTISPLVCLKIPVRNEELQSFFCQKIQEEYSEIGSSISVKDTTAEDIDRWEVDVLQQFKPAPQRFALYLFDDGEIIRLAVPEKFDLRLVTLDDPKLEFDVFLAPVSGVEQNQARRVALQKHRILRVFFIAVHHSRDGIFAQKSVQDFFKDFENHGILWKTRDEIMKFAASYQANVNIQLQIFYRHGDGEQVELTQPQQVKQDNVNEILNTSPVLVIGAVLKSRAGDQAQFQIWKFAMNWLTDDAFEPKEHKLDHARHALAVQSSYRLEAQRVLRCMKDTSFGMRIKLMKTRRSELVQNMKNDIRDLITQAECPDDAADKLLKNLNVFMLASFESVGEAVEKFFMTLFNQAPTCDSNTLSRDVSSFIELVKTEQGNCACFSAWIERVLKELAATVGKQELTWDRLSLIIRHVEATSITTAEVGALFVDLGLANTYTTADNSAEHGFQSSLPRLTQQLHGFLCSTRPDNKFSMLDGLYSPRLVAEFIVECANFSSFFQDKMTDLGSRVTELLGSDQSIPEMSYAMQLKAHKWQIELRQLAQSQNTLQSDTSRDKDVNVLQPTTADQQQLQRFLKTPLPSVSPKVSSITLENRCDTIRCRDRFVMNASGKLQDREDFIPLSVLYVIMNTDDETKNCFNQELTFLRKVQHFRVREFFLPACLDIMDAPILPAKDGTMVYTGDTDEFRCIVAESLRGWSSLTECLKFMHSSTFSVEYWKPLLWSWSVRVLMALLTLYNERFSMRENIDMDMLLVSPDGCGLRLCSLSDGFFVRFGESEDANPLGREIARIFGFFIYKLLHRFFSEDEFDVDKHDVDDEMLRKMRSQVLHLVSSKSEKVNLLTDFSSVPQIAACGVGTRENEELERLCELAFLSLQPANSRPGIESLWVHAGRPGINVLSDESVHIKSLTKHFVNLVKLQRLLQNLLQDLRVCLEECEDKSCSENSLQQVTESWTMLLERLFQLKKSTVDKENLPDTQIYTKTLGEMMDNHVPCQLCAISLQMLMQCSKRGNRDLGRKAVEIVLHSVANVFELVETNTQFDELRCNPLFMATIQQILDSLVSIASGQMPRNGLNKTAHSHGEVAENAVLWRLSEPLFRNLLGIEMTASKFIVLLRWLDSRRPVFGYTTVEMPPDQSEEGNLWWNNHDPRIPRHTPSSAAEDELFKNGYSGEAPMTANYLRRVYETKEIEFKLTSGVNVPKFRLAALQQLFGPVFFERKRCFPMVLVDSLVAKVWKNLRFERLICTLLRDSDEKIVLGALSLLDCSTRVFRFDLLRSPTDRSTPLSSYSYTCPERDFAIQLCSQSVVSEVKRVLDKTIRALKVLGESGASSASRSQQPLVAILCVGISWLVNCLRGGDNATQFWGVAGINQLIIAHCKANSLPFVKIKDLNMMNQFFHKAQRVVPDFSTKWRVFASESTRRNCSPFRLILEAIICVGSTRAVGLMRTLLLSHTFGEEADDATVATRDSTFQRDLMSSVDYGKVSHAIDLARDISHMNGTINEQMHVILYVKALFVNYAATSMKVHVRGFAPVCKEIWSWMETAWKDVALHSSPTLIETDKGAKLSRAQGDVIIAGFSLLHLIISHPAVLIEDIVELTTFNAQDSGESVNVAHELVRWVKILPNGARRKGNTIHVLIESGAALLTNFVHARKYDEVAFATLNTCVSVRKMLELLDCTILSIEEKRQLWSMLLYFDSRTVTSRILDTNFLDTAVFTRLLQSNSLRHRLEALMFLEVLVVAASRCEKSVNTQMLFAEVCKLLLHHDLIAKEATFLRKTRDFGNISSKQVAVCKRVMQVVCCLCVDFSSQSPSRIFLDQLEAVGVPAWVVAFHQAKDAKLDIADNDPRVDVFWKDWQGCVAVATKLSFEPRCKPKKTVAQTVPYSVSQTLSHDRRRKNPSVKVETMSSDEDEVKLKRALVSPVKLSKPKRTATRAQKSASVIQALLTDSALHVVKRSTKPATRKPKDAADDEALDSDAYSPFPGNISSEEENRKFSEASAKRNPSKKKAAESKHSKNKVEQDISDGELSVSSPDQPRKRTFSRKTSKNRATPPQNEALQVIFRKYDVDGDGVISFIDLRRAMDNQLIGRTHRLSDVEIQRWITEKDRSGQGVVSFEDFAIAFQTQASQ